jgi:hypothetical protein
LLYIRLYIFPKRKRSLVLNRFLSNWVLEPEKVKNNHFSWRWWYTTIIPALRSLRQEDHEFEVGLGYIARPFLKKTQAKLKKKKKKNHFR